MVITRKMEKVYHHLHTDSANTHDQEEASTRPAAAKRDLPSLD